MIQRRHNKPNFERENREPKKGEENPINKY
jgi:hypothetical protein